MKKILIHFTGFVERELDDEEENVMEICSEVQGELEQAIEFIGGNVAVEDFEVR